MGMRIYAHRGFSIPQTLIFDDFLMDLLKRLQAEIPSFLTGSKVVQNSFMQFYL